MRSVLPRSARVRSRPWHTAILGISYLCLGFAAAPTAVSATNTVTSRHADVRFTRSAPYAAPAEITRRLGITSAAPGYNLAAEKFGLIVPGDFSTNSAWGLLVWISPGALPTIPSAWEAELSRERLLFVGAYKSGNDRDVGPRNSWDWLPPPYFGAMTASTTISFSAWTRDGRTRNCSMR